MAFEDIAVAPAFCLGIGSRKDHRTIPLVYCTQNICPPGHFSGATWPLYFLARFEYTGMASDKQDGLFQNKYDRTDIFAHSLSQMWWRGHDTPSSPQKSGVAINLGARE